MGAGLASFVPVAFRAGGSVPGLPPGAGIAALSGVGYGAFIATPPAVGFTAGAVGLRNALWIVVALLALLLPLAPAALVRAAEDRDHDAGDGDAAAER
jgi:hypothetical protein